MFTPGARWGWNIIAYPLVAGISFGALTLGIVWSGARVRGVFGAAPLRFIGHISYSIYLWHLPILQGKLAPFAPMPLWLRLVCVFIVSYTSYQLLERPFLRSRQRLHTSAVERSPVEADAARASDLAAP